MKHILPICFLSGFVQTSTYAQSAPGYPKIAGYVGILHPIVTFSREGTTTNFKNFYLGGLPTGINIWKRPVINKIVRKNKNSGYFVAVPLPVRFGNNHAVTRERPKIDRIACPWLIKRFIDPQAEFIYVPNDSVFDEAKKLDAIPYDISGTEYSHYGEECTFDFIVKKYGLTDKAILEIANIVRGADTHRFDLAEQSAGLWAICAGLSFNYKNDLDQLEIGMKLYDALYSWAKYVKTEIHTWENKV
jgi:hypothetical protein